MNIQTGGKVSGVYGIKVLRNAGTDKEHLEDFGESPNMLLDGFFERFASGSLSPSSWHTFVGSGATPVDATQTQLVSQVGNSSSMSVTLNDNMKVGNDYISSSIGIAEWNIGSIVGNISEVGVRMGSKIGSTVDSRALIVDTQGNPTTITVTAEDKLVINYTLKYILPTQPHVSVVDFLGVPTTCTLESLGVLDKSLWNLSCGFKNPADNIYFSNSQGVVGNPEAELGAGNPRSVVIRASRVQSGTRRFTAFAPTDKLNLSTGLSYFAFAFGNSYYKAVGIHFDPKIPKDATKTLTLNFDFTLTRA